MNNVLTVKTLRIESDDSPMSAILEATRDGFGFVVDNDGKRAFSLFVSRGADGPEITVFDRQARAKAEIKVEQGGAFLWLCNPEGERFQGLGVLNGQVVTLLPREE